MTMQFVSHWINAAPDHDGFSTHLEFMMDPTTEGSDDPHVTDEMFARVLFGKSPLIPADGVTLVFPIVCQHISALERRIEIHFYHKGLADLMVYPRSHIKTLWIEKEMGEHPSSPIAPGDTATLVLSDNPIKIRGE